MNMEAQIDAANLDLDAFSQGGPAIEAPKAIAGEITGQWLSSSN